MGEGDGARAERDDLMAREGEGRVCERRANRIKKRFLASRTAPMWVPRWPRETGMSVLTLSVESFGALRRPVAHSSATYGMPTKSCSAAIVYGIGSALSAFLL